MCGYPTEKEQMCLRKKQVYDAAPTSKTGFLLLILCAGLELFLLVAVEELSWEGCVVNYINEYSTKMSSNVFRVVSLEDHFFFVIKKSSFEKI